jgi:hypothetical protein
MSESKILYAIAESCPFDSLLVREMRRSVDALLQLNLRRFRVPQQNLAKYSALDIVKQALELLFEFSPSEKNYREAMRTIQVYSEGDQEMLTTIRISFRLIANAVYNAYTGQRRADSLSPETLFLQGIQFDPNELQKSFRFVGVKPPDISPPSVKKTVFLDEDFEPYKELLDGKMSERTVESNRVEHWAKVIVSNLDPTGKNLIRAGSNHLDAPTGFFSGVRRANKLARLLGRSRVELQIIDRVADVNRVFGK